MQKTTNYQLNKPDKTDFYNIEDMNDNMDTLDEELGSVSDDVSEHIADDVSHITSDERSEWNAKATTDIATDASAGLMSAAMVAKLNGIATGANKTTVKNELTSTSTSAALSANQGKVLKGYMTATNGTTFQFDYDSEKDQYGFKVGDTLFPFHNAAELYDALQYSGLVTESMTYDEMLDALREKYPPIWDALTSTTSQWTAIETTNLKEFSINSTKLNLTAYGYNNNVGNVDSGKWCRYRAPKKANAGQVVSIESRILVNSNGTTDKFNWGGNVPLIKLIVNGSDAHVETVGAYGASAPRTVNFSYTVPSDVSDGNVEIAVQCLGGLSGNWQKVYLSWEMTKFTIK